jgi:hypothetical protein
MSSTAPQIAASELQSLDLLIQRLETTPVLNREDAKRRNREFTSAAARRMLDNGTTFGEAAGVPQLLRQEEASFRAELKWISNRLGEQVKLTEQFLNLWFNQGEPMPPHYPWRITVILRKSKLFDLERRFLSAFSMHFDYGQHGGTGQKITDRATKLNLLIEGGGAPLLIDM